MDGGFDGGGIEVCSVVIRVRGGCAGVMDVVDVEAKDSVSARLSASLVLRNWSTNHWIRAVSMFRAVVAVAQPP